MKMRARKTRLLTGLAAFAVGTACFAGNAVDAHAEDTYSDMFTGTVDLTSGKAEYSDTNNDDNTLGRFISCLLNAVYDEREHSFLFQINTSDFTRDESRTIFDGYSDIDYDFDNDGSMDVKAVYTYHINTNEGMEDDYSYGYTMTVLDSCSIFGSYEVADDYLDDGGGINDFDFTVIFPEQSQSSDSEDEDDSETTPHVHDMQWVVTQEPTAESNGEKCYMCTDCGYVQYRAVLSAFEVWNNDIEKKIRAASQGATVTIDAAKIGWISFSPSIIREIAARPDETIVVDFRYQGKNYEMTIPANADLSQIGDYENAENDECYGFLYLGQFFETREIQK